MCTWSIYVKCTSSMFRYLHEICSYMYIKYVNLCTWNMFRCVHEVCLYMYIKYV